MPITGKKLVIYLKIVVITILYLLYQVIIEWF
jgi:hypothetical protein